MLESEVRYRADALRPEGLFMYQFETLCRNHMRYEEGLTAMSRDPAYSDAWKRWILTVRRQAGLVELPDLVYVRSELYDGPRDDDYVVLFGTKEGRIALANRRKDPLFFFAALQRQLNYPAVPRPEPADPSSRGPSRAGRPRPGPAARRNRVRSTMSRPATRDGCRTRGHTCRPGR